MASVIKFDKNSSGGFSFLEMVMVVAIMGLLLTISVSFFTRLKTDEGLNIATTSVVEAIRRAQSNSETARNDSAWGVKLVNNSVIVFKGSSYAARDTAFDQSLVFPKGVTPGGLSEVVFTKVNGTTTNIGTMTLSNGANTKNILINEKGTVTY